MAKKFDGVFQKCAVFFDFDNTITEKDIFDDMLLCFSRDSRWKKLERDWLKGTIGSRACLAGQIKSIRVTKPALDEYLSGVKIDRWFLRLLKLLKAKNIKAAVLSDNFDYILKKILSDKAVSGIKIYANKIRFSADTLVPEFPFQDKKCRLCAHCKKKNLLANLDGQSIIIYVGDGRSDFCPAEYADVVFAKGRLLEFCRKKNLPRIPYKNLGDVYSYLKRRLA